jgi:RNA 3'-terminal phosphate cyclase (ATP)
MIIIDGSMGEGGGQVLRTSLGLSLVTGKPFRIDNIRAGRPKPGLMRQHLMAVRAAAEISDAKVSGDAIGSRGLSFEPGAVKPGQYEFAVGTAGSATLVLQTVLPALMVAEGPSQLTLRGGTHNPWSPPFDFLAKAFLPLLGRMGARVTAKLIRPGFYPAGGGEFTVEIQPPGACTRPDPGRNVGLPEDGQTTAPAGETPSPRMQPLELIERGEIISHRATAIVARLPQHIAQRELDVVGRKLGWPQESLAAEDAKHSAGPGNIIFIEVQCENVTEVFTGFGELNVRAEAVANKAVEQYRHWLAAGVPVGPHLADQLLVPMALAGAGRFRTVAPTRHMTTNLEVIRQFLDVQIGCNQIERGLWDVTAAGQIH